jgi:hypothetical protein
MKVTSHELHARAIAPQSDPPRDARERCQASLEGRRIGPWEDV